MIFFILGLGCQQDLYEETFRRQEHMAEYFNVLIADEDVVSFEIDTQITVGDDPQSSSCRLWFRLYHVNFGDSGMVTLQVDDEEAEVAIQALDLFSSETQTALKWQTPSGNYNNRLDIPCTSQTHTVRMFHDINNEVLYSLDFVGSVYEYSATEPSIQTSVKVVE